MTSSPQIIQTATTTDERLLAFFQASSGYWRSERRYYTLPAGTTQEGLTLISVQFLAQGSDELLHLAHLHDLPASTPLLCGSYVTWKSMNPEGRKTSAGTTTFGVLGDRLYRDRGFATLKPIAARYHCPTPQALQLHTEYNESSFEEEIKLVGSQYRTRQTIVTKAGEQQLIGQYLETRIDQF